MFQTNFVKGFKFLKNINVLGETNACRPQLKLSTVFVLIAIQNNYNFSSFRETYLVLIRKKLYFILV